MNENDNVANTISHDELLEITQSSLCTLLCYDTLLSDLPSDIIVEEIFAQVTKFCEQLEDLKVDLEVDVDTMWDDLGKSILRVADIVFGCKRGEETTKKHGSGQSQEDNEEYRNVKKETKKIIAVKQAIFQKNLYEQLDTKEGQKHIYKVGKQHCQSTKDPLRCKTVIGPDGELVYKFKFKFKIAVEHGQSITLFISREDEPKLKVIVPQKANVGDLKKAIARHFEIYQKRIRSKVKISWKYIWKTYNLSFDGIILDNNSSAIDDYGVTNKVTLNFKKRRNKNK